MFKASFHLIHIATFPFCSVSTTQLKLIVHVLQMLYPSNTQKQSSYSNKDQMK